MVFATERIPANGIFTALDAFLVDDEKRLAAAKLLQQARLTLIGLCWPKHADFDIDNHGLATLLKKYSDEVALAPDITHLLTQEARLTKTLYALAVKAVKYGESPERKAVVAIRLMVSRSW
ncbi:CRISPR-associated endonuclease Cas1, subtype I-F/YPEST [Budvicia aquatica]|uniref:CRISPR-associated endonuclease Cas1, subtype I-F/YPEST n=1 Tax=Budvicia aquatica TaxID=82979 RepID=A0A484ZN39_9GAMM|nr:CRISPR-associated endonuclease Cas1, subtype I-F/YPEST [Budvicia aquatica]